MPNVTLTYIPVTDEQFTQLQKKITDIFVKGLGCAESDVHIRMNEIQPTRYASGGVVNPGSDLPLAQQPLIQMDVKWYAGKKYEMACGLAEKFAAAISETLGIDKSKIEMGIDDMHNRNYFIGGKPVEAEPSAPPMPRRVQGR